MLVFSKTTGFRHDSIPAGIAAIQKLGADNGFAVDATEDATQFTDANLAQYDTVVFLSTTGDPLDQQSERDAFQHYIEAGGGFVGIHAAADSGYAWQWYGGLVGAYFKQHPAIQQATVKVEDRAHPSTQSLPTSWSRTDEWYDYRSNPRSNVHVLTSLDEASYTGGTMGIDHPNTWCQDYDGGRAWYTGLGHSIDSFSEPNFLKLILGGIETTAGAVKADCSASLDGSFQKVTLDDNTSNPMMLDVAKDGRVFYIDLNGDVKVIKPAGGTLLSGHLNVFTANESGLLGLALDPNFDSNHWMYLFYSPSGANVDRLSRFTVTGDIIDMTSEKVVLDVPVQRAECCHHGGSLVFDRNTGNLFLATGDNTNPFASDGYAPTDEQPGRGAWDAQRTSGNTNNLSGKVLRIHPQPDGTYTIPSGNLFPPGTALTKPEIYTMGERNPFRINIDPMTGRLLIANYGPDAQSPNPARGPENAVEWEVVDQAQNNGWPYCIGPNQPYIDYDFATRQSGPAFNCAAPVNNSPNNTGLTNLPPAVPAQVWYHYQTDPAHFPELHGGAPMAGPVYRYDASLTSDRKWPAYWDGKAIFGEWNTNSLFSFQLAENNHDLVKINQILKSFSFLKPMDMTFGPDGALYLIEWGSGFGGNNADSGVYRIDYVKGTRAPIARASADKTSGPAPLTVQFASAGSRDPDGSAITYAWDFDGDGTTDSTDPNPSHTYSTPGNYSATLTVTNAAGRMATASVPITSGNTTPTVRIELPPAGGFFEWGDQIKYKITVSDPEDGTIDCGQVKLQAILGHDTHGHPLDQYTGCEGTVQTALSSGHDDTDNIFYVLEATYTDQGGVGGARTLTGRDQVILQPKHRQAEFYTTTGRVPGGSAVGDPGVQAETADDPQGGGLDIGYIEDGDYWSFDPTNLTDITSVGFRVASATAGGTIEMHSGAPDGQLVGSAAVGNTGGWQTYKDVTAPVSNAPTTSGPLFFVVRKPAGGADTSLLNVNWVDFNGKGVTENQRPTATVTANPQSGTAPLKVDFASTATDPEGDTPLTYSWDFGVPNSPHPTTPTASYTYTAPGDYTATLTVKDSKNAATTVPSRVHVDAPNTACLGQLSDDFSGTSLDESRWTTIIRRDQNLTVSNGALHIPTSNTDIYGAGTGTTPNIVLQNAPSGPWQATTKVTLAAARDAFQQAGLIVYGDDDNYAKMVLEARGTNDANNRIFQFIREENGVPNEVAASNTPTLGSAYPDTAYVRLTSDGTNITAAYSKDNATWTSMPQTDKKLAGITNPKIGLLSLSGTGSRPVIDAAFDWFQLTPDPTITAPAPDDEFGDATVNKCRWSTIVREDPAGYRLANGQLEIDTSAGDIYGTPNSDPKNFMLQSAPGGDWTIETKVDGSAFNEHYQQAGLMVYKDDANYVKFDYITDNDPGSAVARRIELRSETGDQAPAGGADATNLTQGVWWLKLQKIGNDYHGFYSSDGTTWTEVTDANGAPAKVSNTAVGSGPKVGVFAFGVNQTASKTAKFDYFHVTGPAADTTAPTTTATLSPAAPTGANGWYTAPAQVTLAATDDQGGRGVDKTEYQLDDAGTWTPYTAPFEVAGDGAHTVAFRSTDKAGNTETAKSVSIKMDATKPALDTTQSPATPNGENGWYTSAVTVTATATDATSGVDKVTYDLDGNTGQPYAGPVTVSGDGAHTLVVHATDKAGNTVDTSRAINIDAIAPVSSASFAPANDDGWHNGKVPVTISATDATSAVAGSEYNLDGGGWTAYTGPVDVSGDGEHSLLYRSKDKAGNIEQEKGATIKIDPTAPTLLVSGVADGQLYGDSQDVHISWAATDATSGIKSTVGTLDGAPYASGPDQPLYALALGQHTLTVTTSDRAGNTTTSTVRFYVTTSFRDMASLIDRFEAAGRLSHSTSKSLQGQLTAIRLKEAKGKDQEAVKLLEEFKKTVDGKVTDAEVHDVLIRDTDAMIVRLGGTPANGKAARTSDQTVGSYGRLDGDAKSVTRR
ncbi:ThuA domain-containing protein [Micromonospora sp. NBC_00898]|uniref:ThuA domain-containing protein n=1 Tax=Micromonospora sp. NBC_00898 TaxID=2975981 RepID=UPI003866FFC0|nr:ThuA domain-containing protein [Micromonospora sp. NBC_00898]